MYLSHFELKQEPFSSGPDPEFLWMSATHTMAFKTLKEGILDRDGCVLLTGDIGTGKTVLIKRLVQLDDVAAVFLIRKKRDETPLPSVTQLQYERHGIAAAILEFGDLEVETFTGNIGMRNMPTPMHIKGEIQEEVEKLQARERAAGRKGILDDLEKRIIANELVEVAPPPPEEPPPLRPTISFGVFRYFFPKLVDIQGDSIIWRKHWIILWRRAVWSTALILAAALAFLNWYNGASPLGTLLDDGVWWIWPFILGCLGAWWWWVFEDWRNDLYMLTANHIIQIERLPFLLNEKRKEFKLSNFQSTEVKIA